MCLASLKAMAQKRCKVLEYHITGECLINCEFSERHGINKGTVNVGLYSVVVLTYIL